MLMKRSVNPVPSEVKGMTVFNTEDVNTKKQPMFFGKPLGVQRYDNFKYPQFENLTKQQLGYFGDQKKYLYRKIVETIKRYVQNKSTSIRATLSTRSCWILYKVVLLVWLSFHTVHYLNLKHVWKFGHLWK